MGDTFKPGWLKEILEDASESVLAHALATVAPKAVIDRATPEELRAARERVRLEQAHLDEFLRHD